MHEDVVAQFDEQVVEELLMGRRQDHANVTYFRTVVFANHNLR